jgi:hypothetical protein
MGLCLYIMAQGKELGGSTIGHYSDFYDFRSTVVEKLENGKAGSRFPTLMFHSDCDGEWTPNQCAKLEAELNEITLAFQNMPPFELKGWQRNVADEFGLQPKNLFESFIDVDGEPLLEQLLLLCRLSQQHRQPILFR